MTNVIDIMSEKQLQDAVLELAHLRGWYCYHNPDSRRSAPGWPDLFLMRPPRTMFVELKTSTGRLSKEQQAVLFGLHKSGLDTRVWRPAEWRDGTIESALK